MNGKHDTQARWSPDGKYLAFVRAGDKDETGKAQAFSDRCLAGRRRSTDHQPICLKARRIRSGRRIASASHFEFTTPEDIEKAQHAKKRQV